MKRKNSGVRWREDTGFELRCTKCGSYWPLTFEFWDRKSLTRCKACWAAYRRQWQRDHIPGAAEREARRAYQARYRADAKKAKSIYSFDYYWKDPEIQRARARDRYWRKRDEILAKKRERYEPTGPRWTPQKREEAGRKTAERYKNMSEEERRAFSEAVSRARKKAA